ncbi:hypothetical protein HMPREF1548_06945 [Clostridium sp. KLE 1755]|nr:hypothetical protein HMPREF1548_06945 [Clostridium sp. KLE 1755]
MRRDAARSGRHPFLLEKPDNILTGKAYYLPCKKTASFTILKLQGLC